jgi:ketosteroid isomerase-like protein
VARLGAVALAGALALALLARGGAPAAAAGNAPAAAGAPDAAVTAARQLLADQQAAWNRGDLAGFMDAYWKSDSLTFYSAGDTVSGWRVVYDRYSRRYLSEGAEMGRLDFVLHTVVPLGKDYVLVRGAWYLKRSGDAPHGLFTLVLRRFPGLGWRIVHDHTSVAG